MSRPIFPAVPSFVVRSTDTASVSPSSPIIPVYIIKDNGNDDMKKYFASPPFAIQNFNLSGLPEAAQLLAISKNALANFPTFPIIVVKDTSTGILTPAQTSKLITATGTQAAPYDIFFLGRYQARCDLSIGKNDPANRITLGGSLPEYIGYVIDGDLGGLQAAIISPSGVAKLAAFNPSTFQANLRQGIQNGTFVSKSYNPPIPFFLYNASFATSSDDYKKLTFCITGNGPSVRPRGVRDPNNPVNGWAIAFWVVLIILIVVVIIAAVLAYKAKKAKSVAIPITPLAVAY